MNEPPRSTYDDDETAWIYDELDPKEIVAGLDEAVKASRDATRVPAGFVPASMAAGDADDQRAA